MQRKSCIRLMLTLAAARVLELVWLLLMTQFFLISQPAFAQCCSITELQPFSPTTLNRGGRIVAIAISPGNLNTLIVASFSGGLFKSGDGGSTWQHIDSFPANRVADVKFDPEDESVLIASVQVDSHNPSLSGIWRSSDGGQNWTPKNTDMPPCDTPPHPALGGHISFGPGPNVFVATYCGLAVSHTRGLTWSHPVFDASPGQPDVVSVTSRPGAQFPFDPNSVVVDFCGAKGPQRSHDNAATFGPLPAANNNPHGFPQGNCSITTSPSEPFVLVALSAVNGTEILWESDNADDANVSWHPLDTFNFFPERPPWVVARPTFNGDDTHFNVYVHDGGDLHRLSCNVLNTGPTPADSALRCPTSTLGVSWSTIGIHDHHAEGFSLENCTIFDANDTGMTRSTCGPPWASINAGLGALQIYGMSGTVHIDHTDLYLGTQDNNILGSNDGGNTWPDQLSAEGFGLQAPHSRSLNDQLVSGNTCGPPCPTFVRDFQLANPLPWNPPSAVGSNARIYLIGQGNGSSAKFATTGGPCTVNGAQTAKCLFACDQNGNCSPQVPLPPLEASPHLYVAGPMANPTIYAVTSKGTNNLGEGIRGLVQIANFSCPSTGCPNADNGLGSLYIWAPDDAPYDQPVVFGVDPSNPNHLIAADLIDETMKFSVDGGQSWHSDLQLTALVTDSGRLLFHTPFLGLQPHVIAFDPSSGGARVLIGTEANGVIASVDGGGSWFKVPGSEIIPAISDFFFDELRQKVYVSSYGRGLWTITGIPFIPSQANTLTVKKVIIPSNDLGRFDLLVDGAVQLAGAGNNGTAGPIQLPPGPHTVAESPSVGTVGSQYSTWFQGDCAPNGTVMLQPGSNKTCTLVNSHGSGAFLTVKKVLKPATDPGRFDISVDGALLLPSAGDSATTVKIPLPPGSHFVSEIAPTKSACSGDYSTQFEGVCSAGGFVTLAPGDDQICTIVNTSPKHICSRGLVYCPGPDGQCGCRKPTFCQ